jgi:hypothetical protein
MGKAIAVVSDTSTLDAAVFLPVLFKVGCRHLLEARCRGQDGGRSRKAQNDLTCWSW